MLQTISLHFSQGKQREFKQSASLLNTKLQTEVHLHMVLAVRVITLREKSNNTKPRT